MSKSAFCFDCVIRATVFVAVCEFHVIRCRLGVHCSTDHTQILIKKFFLHLLPLVAMVVNWTVGHMTEAMA